MIVREWTPIERGLPEPERTVLVRCSEGEKLARMYPGAEGRVYWMYNGKRRQEVTAWSYDIPPPVMHLCAPFE